MAQLLVQLNVAADVDDELQNVAGIQLLVLCVPNSNAVAAIIPSVTGQLQCPSIAHETLSP